MPCRVSPGFLRTVNISNFDRFSDPHTGCLNWEELKRAEILRCGFSSVKERIRTPRNTKYSKTQNGETSRS
eukprot:3095756-Amphidinium_carterae.1